MKMKSKHAFYWLLIWLALLGWLHWLLPSLKMNSSPGTILGPKTKQGGCDFRHLSTGSLFLSVSSLGQTSTSGSIIERRLQINWQGFKVGPLDTVALYNHDPRTTKTRLAAPLDQTNANDYPGGLFTTRVQFPRFKFTTSNLTNNCLGFWAAYLKNGLEILSVTCIRSNPFWMGEIKEHLKILNLTTTVIPGTHNAGSYQAYLGERSEQVVPRYLYAQDETVFNQLAYGIRYLDLRVGFYGDTKEKFWINHSLVWTNNLLATVLADIKAFLHATSEVVIMDIHYFLAGFQNKPKAHKLLIEYLVQELGSFMAPFELGYGVSLFTLMEMDKRLLLTYNSEHYRDHPLLWPGVRHKWGNKQVSEDLITYLNTTFHSESEETSLWSAMAELTPAKTDLVFFNSLRLLAEEINPKLTSLFRDNWYEKSNIVATDYFLGNNLIEVSIVGNQRKACSGSFG